MKDAGVEFYDVSDNAAEWEATTEPVLQQWINDAERAGHPAQRVVDDFETAIERNQFRDETSNKPSAAASSDAASTNADSEEGAN